MQLAKITTGNHFHHAINVRIGTFRIIMVILLSSWIFVLTVMHSSVCIENQSASNGSQETKTLSQPFPKASTTFSSSRRLMRSSGPQSTVTSNVSVDYSSKDTNPKQAAAATEKSRFKKNVTLLAAALPKTSTKAAELKKAPTESSKISTTLSPPVPSFLIDDLYRKEQERIDAKPPEERCAAFGVSPIPNAKLNRRRLFFGSMLADENLDVLTIHAMEAHGIYHAVAFVESNTTHSGAARTMRFHNATKEEMWIRHSNMFGNETKVLVEYWLEDMPGLKGMDREVEQRQPIVTMWKRAGMTRDDVAVMADVDEIPSRNFLRALQECDFPELQRQELPSCQKPKMLLSTLVFESSPHCISKRGWYHPDVIL
jgi:Glycosyltransferase family 17